MKDIIMKFRRLVFVFIGLVILLAWFTKPDLEKFQEFYASEARQIGTPPVIEARNNFVYSRFDVSHFDKITVGTDNAARKSLAVPVRKSVYIGLFGRFWKMD